MPCFATPIVSQAPVELIYFGNSRGISAHQSYSNIEDLRLEQHPLKVGTKGPYAYVCDGFTMASNGPLTVMEFQKALNYFLSPNGMGSVAKEIEGYLSPFEAVMNTGQAGALSTGRQSFTPVRWLSKALPGVGTPRLFYDPNTPLETLPLRCAQPSAWQIRFVAHSDSEANSSASAIIVRRPFGDGIDRTDQLLRYLDSRTSNRPMVISAGNNFEGLSFLHPNAPDLQRENTLESLGLINTDLIMMGPSERRFGAVAFRALAKKHKITALDTMHTVLRTVSGKRILMVNLNPGALPVNDYLNSVKKEIDTLRQHDASKPDLIIGLGVLDEQYAQALQTQDLGIDILLWQFHGKPYVSQEMSLEVSLPTHGPISMLPVGKTCWGHLSIEFTEPRTIRITQRTHPIFSTVHESAQPALIKLSAKVNQVRQSTFKAQQTPFLDGMPAQFQTKQGWRNLSASALQRHLKADIAVIKPYPVPWSIQNPILRLNAIANLPISDTTSILKLSGTQLKTAVSKGVFVGFVTSGLDLSSKKVGGRPINPRRTYTVATGRTIADRIAESITLDHREDLETSNLKCCPSSAFVQTMILESMPRTLQTHLTMRTPPKKVPEWYLDLSQLTLEGGRLHRVGNPDEYGDVSEPRLTIKDHQQVAVRGKMAVGYDSDELMVVNYVDWAFAQSFLEGAPAQETDDRLEFGNEVVLSQFHLINHKAAPFFRTAYLTEFTAAELDGPNIRKRRVESVLGSLWHWDKRNQARLGLSIAADLAAQPVEPQFGLYGQFEFQKKLLGFASFAKGELRYLPPQLQQLTSRQLQLYGDAEIGILLPLWRRISVRSYVGGFYYQSDQTYNRTPGVNLRGGVALNLDHLIPF